MWGNQVSGYVVGFVVLDRQQRVTMYILPDTQTSMLLRSLFAVSILHRKEQAKVASVLVGYARFVSSLERPQSGMVTE